MTRHYADNPGLAPIFYTQGHIGQTPFYIGFDFLGGELRWGERAEVLKPRQRAVALLTVAGRSKESIAKRLDIATPTVTLDRRAAYQAASVYECDVPSAALLCGCLATRIMCVPAEGWGNRDQFPVSNEDLPYIGHVAKGESDTAVAAALEAGYTGRVVRRLQSIADKVRFSGRESLVLGAVITHQLDYNTFAKVS